MAKAEAPRIGGVVVQRETTAPPEVNIKNYVDLLWVVGAGVLGFSLLCVTAGIALANPNMSASLQPQSIIQIAIANVNTAAALTMEAFPQHLITPTLVPSNTLETSKTSSPTAVASITPTVTASAIFIQPTGTDRTRGGANSNPEPLSTATLVPTQTNSPLPPPTLTSSPNPSPTITRTPRPTRTRTPIPSPTDTPLPPTITNTPRPTMTRTPIPPTIEPTLEPTQEPTLEPTLEPTIEPTLEPTPEPTTEPTVEPTTEPTAEPTVESTPQTTP